MCNTPQHNMLFISVFYQQLSFTTIACHHLHFSHYILSQRQILGTGNLPSDSALVCINNDITRDGSTDRATKPSIMCHCI